MGKDTITYTYGTTTYSESYDSRDATNDADGKTGDGTTKEVIYSKIRIRGYRFESRPCDVYNHADGNIYPPFFGTKRYNWFVDNSVSPSPINGPYPAAYLKGAAPKLNVETDPLSSSVSVRVLLNVSASSPTSYYSTVSGYPIGVPATLANSNVTATLPALPGTVNIYDLGVQADFQCKLNDGTWASIYGRSTDSNSFRLYALYAQPNNPMNNPWIGVLEDTCKWAHDESAIGIVGLRLTTGLFYSRRMTYTGQAGFPSKWLDSNGNFKLTEFLNTGGTVNANCVDVSDYLCICAASQGLNFQTQQFSNRDGANAQTNFQTGFICSIGHDSTMRSEYKSFEWSMHQFCLLNNGVYDACAAQLSSPAGNPYKNPPGGWDLPSYWQTQKPVYGFPGSYDIYGLVSKATTDYFNGTPSTAPTPCSPLELHPMYQPGVK